MKTAIAGLGTIGLKVAKDLHQGIPGLELSAVSSGRPEIARARLAEAGIDVPVLTNGELPGEAKIIVECAPSPAFREIAEAALGAGCILVTVSGAALIEAMDLVELAEKSGGRIHLATGALIGLDAVNAAALGTIHSVKMITRKPPPSLATAPHVVENKIDLTGLSEPLRLYSGPARLGVKGFPANLNVAAALSLAGIGADRTDLEIWADPGVTRNTHRIEVDSDTAHFSMSIENIPSEENPATGRITHQSVVAALRGLVEPLRVGS